MSELLIIHCDKCDSTNVLHEIVTAKPQEVHKTMQQVVEDSKKIQTIHSVHYYTRYKMICKNCGHIVEYQV